MDKTKAKTMATLTLYGIKNCDTVKRARTWLKTNEIEYEFHNYKKDGVNKDVLEKAIEKFGWEVVINQRGTTWRHVPDKIKKNLDADSAMALAIENPSVIKRPLLVQGNEITLGFKEDDYAAIFKK